MRVRDRLDLAGKGIISGWGHPPGHEVLVAALRFCSPIYGSEFASALVVLQDDNPSPYWTALSELEIMEPSIPASWVMATKDELPGLFYLEPKKMAENWRFVDAFHNDDPATLAAWQEILADLRAADACTRI